MIFLVAGSPDTGTEWLILLSPLLGVGAVVTLVGLVQLTLAPVWLDEERQADFDEQQELLARFTRMKIELYAGWPTLHNADGTTYLIIPIQSLANRTPDTDMDIDIDLFIKKRGEPRFLQPLEGNPIPNAADSLIGQPHVGQQLCPPIVVGAKRRAMGFIGFDVGHLDISQDLTNIETIDVMLSEGVENVHLRDVHIWPPEPIPPPGPDTPTDRPAGGQ